MSIQRGSPLPLDAVFFSPLPEGVFWGYKKEGDPAFAPPPALRDG